MVIGIPLKIAKREIRPGVVVLDLTGPICAGPDCQRLEQEVEQLLGRREKRLILDLSGVLRVDSTGVGQIVVCYSKLKKSGGSLRLAGVQGMVVGVFRMTGVDRIIGIYPTAFEAAGDFLSDGDASA